MKQQLHYIKTALKAELLKTKGLGLLYVGIFIAGFLPLFNLAIPILDKDLRTFNGFPTSIFSHNILEGYSGFGSFFLLIFIIIITSRIAQSDHKNNGWTFMEAQPLSKLAIYTGKFLTAIYLTTICCLLYYVFFFIVSTITGVLFPSENLNFSIEFELLLHSFLRMWLLSLGIIALQMMISMVFSSFIWPIIIGFFGIFINIGAQLRGEIYDFIPFNNIYTGTSINDPNILNHYFNYTEYLSVFWTIVYFVIGYLIYSKKGILKAFFIPKKRIPYSLLGLAVILGFYFLLTRPIHTEKMQEKTIVEGCVESNINITNVKIFTNELHEKIAEIPVKNGKFKWETNKDIPFGSYTLNANNRTREIYLSKGDHLTVKIKMNTIKDDFLIKGTRKAEFHYLTNVNSGFSMFYSFVVNRKRYTEEPEKFYTEAQEEWEKEKKALEKYRTKENIYLSEDFKDYMEQEKAITMLNALYNYQKITSFDDKKFAIPEGFEKELKAVIAQPKDLLFSSKNYKEWKMKQFLPKEGSENPDSIILAKLQKMPNSLEKDRLLSYEMVKLLKLTETDSARTAFFKEQSTEFKNAKYKNYVAQQLAIINAQQKSSPFPHLSIEDKNGKIVELLQKFKGKYIVIDWWATWCAPCIEIKPSFEYEAKINRFYDKFVFVSISIDKDKKAWQLEIKDDKSNVQHFWLNDKAILTQLGINSIPRFMIIAPNGKMYNSDLAKPGESNFKETLNEIRYSK